MTAKKKTKKPEAKKPEAKKPEAKKPENKKPESKKLEAKKPESEKPENENSGKKIDYAKRAKENFSPDALNIPAPEIDSDFSQSESPGNNPLQSGEDKSEDKPKKKRGRGRPKGSKNKKSKITSEHPSEQNGESGEVFAELIPVFGDMLINVTSRTGFIENSPLNSTEKTNLKKAFAAAYPKVEVSSKATFFFVVISVFLSRAKI